MQKKLWKAIRLVAICAAALCLLTGCGEKASDVLKAKGIKSMGECFQGAEVVEDFEVSEYDQGEGGFNRSILQVWGFESMEEADKAVAAYVEYLVSQGFAEDTEYKVGISEINYRNDAKGVVAGFNVVEEYQEDGKWKGHPLIYVQMQYNE